MHVFTQIYDVLKNTLFYITTPLYEEGNYKEQNGGQKRET